MAMQRKLTDADYKFLRDNVQRMSIPDFVEYMEVSANLIYEALNILGIRVSKGYISQGTLELGCVLNRFEEGEIWELTDNFKVGL